MPVAAAPWTSPFSNHLLLETGYSAFYTDNGDPRPYGVLTDFIPVTEQSTGVGVPFDRVSISERINQLIDRIEALDPRVHPIR